MPPPVKKKPFSPAPVLPLAPISPSDVELVGAYNTMVVTMASGLPTLYAHEPMPHLVPGRTVPFLSDLLSSAQRDPATLAPQTKTHLHITTLWWDYRIPLPISGPVAVQLEDIATSHGLRPNAPVSLVLAHVESASELVLDVLRLAIIYWTELSRRQALTKRSHFYPGTPADIALRLLPPALSDNLDLGHGTPEDRQALGSLVTPLLASIGLHDTLTPATPAMISAIHSSVAATTANLDKLQSRRTPMGLGLDWHHLLATGREQYLALEGSVYAQLARRFPATSSASIFLLAERFIQSKELNTLDYIFTDCGLTVPNHWHPEKKHFWTRS